MTKLLMNEPALQVLPTLATRLGLNEAVFLQQLHFLTNEKRPDQNGLRWVRKTYPEWKRTTFPFWSVSTIERTAKALAKLRLVVIEQRDKSNRNRDNYYAIDHVAFAAWEIGDKSDDGLEPAKMTVSEDPRMTDSDAVNMAGSSKDQISSDQEEDQTPRKREDIVKPRPPAEAIATSDPNANAKRNLLTFLENQVGPVPNRGRETKALNWLLDREYSPGECAACLEWLLGQSWRTTVPTFVTVQKEIGNWVRLGSPEAGESTAGGNGHHPEPQKLGDYIREDEHFVYTVGPEGPGGTVMRKPKTPEGVSMMSGIPVEEVRKRWN